MSPKVARISASPRGAIKDGSAAVASVRNTRIVHFILLILRLRLRSQWDRTAATRCSCRIIQILESGELLAYDDLRAWIAALERAGELKTIRTEVDPILEITEITDRVSKNVGRRPARAAGLTRQLPGGPALLFTNVKGHPGSQVLINQFGSARRMNLALEVDSLDQVADRIRAFMDVKSPQGFLDKVKMLPMLAEMGKFFPRTVATGPCKEVIKRDNFSLLDFPVLQCWPKDAGRFITLPCVVTRDARTGKRNVGMYRMQVYDERTTGMHWQRQKVGAEHYREALRNRAGASAPLVRPGEARQSRGHWQPALPSTSWRVPPAAQC